MTLKIVQLVAPSEKVHATLVALCDDGTLWGLVSIPNGIGWFQLPPIPQPEETEPS